MPGDPLAELGAFLSGQEASGLAVALRAGDHVGNALQAINSARRPVVEKLLTASGISHEDVPRSVAVLEAVAGAKCTPREHIPVWTMPGNAADVGHLTGEFHRLVGNARLAITCATYNFEPTSKMWQVLADASCRPGVTVTVYVDGTTSNAEQVKAQMPRATIYRSGVLADGTQVVSHAKFTIIDHALVLLTSANFSYSAEKRNVELGLLVQGSGLAESIEGTMRAQHGTLYELVGAG